MTRRLTNQLLDATVQAARLAAIDQSAQLRFGTVTAYNAGAKTINCTVAGEPLYDIPCMKSYATPTAGDIVWLLHQGSTVIAIGEF